MTRPPNAPDPSFSAALDRCLDRVADSFEEAELGDRLEQELRGLRPAFANLAARLHAMPPPGPPPTVIRLRGPRRRTAEVEAGTAVLLLQGAEGACVGDLLSDLGETVRVGDWQVRRSGLDRTTLWNDAFDVELRPDESSFRLEVRPRSAALSSQVLRLHDGREERAPRDLVSGAAVFAWSPRSGDRLELRAGSGSEERSWSLPLGGEQ